MKTRTWFTLWEGDNARTVEIVGADQAVEFVQKALEAQGAAFNETTQEHEVQANESD